PPTPNLVPSSRSNNRHILRVWVEPQRGGWFASESSPPPQTPPSATTAVGDATPASAARRTILTTLTGVRSLGRQIMTSFMRSGLSSRIVSASVSSNARRNCNATLPLPAVSEAAAGDTEAVTSPTLSPAATAAAAAASSALSIVAAAAAARLSSFKSLMFAPHASAAP
ncbi:unnamed protein product, partial [Ectocarpus sp. 12 AP-2014]